MRQSFVQAGFHVGGNQDVGVNYPFSAQYKGEGWYIYNAALNSFGTVRYPSAAAAEEAAKLAKELSHGY